ncbi:MAG: molybdopterin-dependent oxidoreductase [Thermoleophilia bacterium]|nr:molybdopterin-dependent oxidoreductase [Thermoleophilia bacterium]
MSGPEARREAQPEQGEKTVVRGLCFIGIPADSNSVQVECKNGRIVRIRPLHYNWKYPDLKPWEMKARGKTFSPCLKSLIPPYTLGYKNRVYSPNRVLYPLKRVDWDPSGAPGSTGPGGRNTQNRGKSKFVRISWDEALDIVASELKRIKETYGMEAVLSQSDGHGETAVVHAAHGCMRRLLRILGGYTLQTRNTDSWEGWYWGAKHVWGCESLGQMVPVANVMWDVSKHSDGILFWGCDPETTPWGFDGQLASRLCYWWSELGIKSIYVCPDLNYGAAVHADKWVPVLPNTDAALYLAIAYVWITEGTYDKEYVETHTVGFDKFRAYVLGEEDGIPKDPKWAAEITGVPSYTIRALARYWGKHTVSVAIGNGGPGIRGPYATEPARLQALLLAMQGLGKPGVHQFKMIEWGLYNKKSNIPLPPPKYVPVVLAAHRGWAYTDTPPQFIPKDLIHDAILNPPISWYGTTLSRDSVEQQFIKYTYPREGGTEIHMIWTDTPSWVTCWNDTNSYVRALQHPKIEFILAQHPWMENDCLLADLVLPSLTVLETKDIGVETLSGQFACLFYEDQAIAPRGESKSDYEIVCAIAERLGVLEEYTGGKSVDDWIKIGWENSGAANEISFEELKEKGYYVVPQDPDWEKEKAGLYDFYVDPENHPLSTPSGKIEFYSERLAKHFPDDNERPPMPRWIPEGESHNENRLGERGKKYPLLVVSNHPRWRVHSQHDDMVWLREIRTCKIKGPDGYYYEPLWIHPDDARPRGISDGDVVKIYNERGAVLAAAWVTERIRPGAVYIDHGARWDPLEPGVLDRGGAINTITPHKTTSKNATGMVCSGFLVEVERADLEELRRQYPEAFSRPYHPDAGFCRERVLAGKDELS